jgi:glycosidase/glycogen synthase
MYSVAALSASEWKRRTIYQITVDRFALERGQRDICYEGDCLYGNFCGGTFLGTADRLNYIKGMGYDAIWISPTVENMPCGYHGFWTKNLWVTSPQFGGEGQLTQLMQKARSMKMAVMFDVVVNNVGPNPQHDFGVFSPFNESRYYHNDYDNFSHCEDVNREDYFLPLRKSGNNTVASQLLREKCWRVGKEGSLADLNQDAPDVSETLFKWIQSLKDKFQFDGLHVSGANYVSKAFLQQLKTKVLPDTWVVADVTAKGQSLSYLASYQYTEHLPFEVRKSVSSTSLKSTPYPPYGYKWPTSTTPPSPLFFDPSTSADGVYGQIVDGVLNYPLFFTLRSIFQDVDPAAKRFRYYVSYSGDNGDPKLSMKVFWDEWQVIQSAFQDIGGNMNFVDMHNMPRWFMHSPAWPTYKAALVLAFMLPGVPMSVYGAEQNVKGINGGESNHHIRQPMWSGTRGYDEMSHMYQWTRQLIAARSAMLEDVSDELLDDISNVASADSFISFQRGNALIVTCKAVASYESGEFIEVQTSFPMNTMLCDVISAVERANNEYCINVEKDGKVRIMIAGQPLIFTKPRPAKVSPATLWMVRLLLPFWFLPVVILFFVTRSTKRILVVMDPPLPIEMDGPNKLSPAELDVENRTILIASIEHIIDPGRIDSSSGLVVPPVKTVAGGLGKVAGLLCKSHPTKLISVHPTMPDKDYQSFAEIDNVNGPIKPKLLDFESGRVREFTCDIFTYTRKPTKPGEPEVIFYIIDHIMFRERKEIYPAPNTRGDVLAFYSLWNQAVAILVNKLKPDIYHCPDYHGAMAPLYFDQPVPTVVTLHNAEYQGSVGTEPIKKKQIEWLSCVFNLPKEKIKSETVVDGTFNMLYPLVRYVQREQAGYGICAVSRNYALEVTQRYSLFWRLPEIRGIENCMPEAERPTLNTSDFASARINAKRSVQEEYNLNKDPDARLFVFLGRWVKQKGMDYIADITEWMLTTHPKAQLIMIGPIGDCYGNYTRMRMQGLMDSEDLRGRLFVHAGFLTVSKEFKLACDFCLMPSRDEPFGYVDIEFAWYGALIVGSFKGGLGKLPGFYYKMVNKDSPIHVQSCLRGAIDAAMKCDAETLERMSEIARQTAFPQKEWCQELVDLYATAWYHFRKKRGLEVKEMSGNFEDSKTVPLLANDSEQAPPRTLKDVGGSAQGGLKKAVKAPMNKLPVVHSVGENLDQWNSLQDEPIPDDLGCLEGVQEIDFGDRSDAVSVSSLETDNHHTLAVEERTPGAWARQVTPMLSGHPNLQGGFSREVSACAPGQYPAVSPEHSNALDGEFSRGLGDYKFKAEEDQEFLKQEPIEEDVQGVVEAKTALCTFFKQDARYCDALLEETLWELEVSTEENPTARILGTTYCNVNLLDWIICFAYVTGPLVSFAFVSSGPVQQPAEFENSPFSSLDFLRLVAQGCGCLTWTFLGMWFKPHYLMALVIFLRLGQFPLSYGNSTNAAIMTGVIQSGDILLLFFSFMGQAQSDISKLAVRTGLMFSLRSGFERLVEPMQGTGDTNPLAVIFLCILGTLSSLFIPLILMKAPQAYRVFRIPGFCSQLVGMRRLKCPCLLGLSNVFRGLTYAPSLIFMVWRSGAPRPDTFQEYYTFTTLATWLTPALLAWLLGRYPDTAVPIVKVFSCFSFPVTALRCWPMLEAVHWQSTLLIIDFLSVAAVSFDIVYQMASAVTIVSTLGSRWRFSAFMCLISTLTYFTQALSYGTFFFVANQRVESAMHAGKDTQMTMKLEELMRPERLTTQLLIWSMLPCIPEFLCRMVAYRFFDQEFLPMVWTDRHRKMERMCTEKNTAMLASMEKARQTAGEA